MIFQRFCDSVPRDEAQDAMYNQHSSGSRTSFLPETPKAPWHPKLQLL